MRVASQRGSASVEQVALFALIAIVFALAVAVVAGAPPGTSARLLGGTIARRIACAPRHPVPCGRNPLALVYGFPVGKLVRLLAPPLGSLAGPTPVDFRRCRTPGCSGRPTLFTSVRDLRASGGGVRVSYWLYRPTLGWRETVAVGSEADIARASAIRLDLEDDPALVPLETLPGRNHARFTKAEEPPWRWRVPSAHPLAP